MERLAKPDASPPTSAGLTLMLGWLLANGISAGLAKVSLVLATSFAVTQWLVLRRYLRPVNGWLLVSVGGWLLTLILLYGLGLWPNGTEISQIKQPAWL